MTRLVAFLFHAPGLWIVYRRSLDARERRANRVAIALTLVAMACAALLSWKAVVIAWGVGHVAWGAWLAVNVRSR